MNNRSFTLLELVVVIVILGVLSTMAVNHFVVAREKALEKEAFANLKLMQAAQKIYNMETTGYYLSASVNEINDNLRLSLNNKNWLYETGDNGCSQATRVSNSALIYSLRVNSIAEPVLGQCS